MSEPQQSQQPWLIPYVDHYDGPTRVLTLNLTSGNGQVVSRYRPVVSIDGRQYVVVWGAVSFEIPAERNVHLSVHLHGELIAQVASLLLPPGADPVGFLYETNYIAGVGTLKPMPVPPQPR